MVIDLLNVEKAVNTDIFSQDSLSKRSKTLSNFILKWTAKQLVMQQSSPGINVNDKCLLVSIFGCFDNRSVVHSLLLYLLGDVYLLLVETMFQ